MNPFGNLLRHELRQHVHSLKFLTLSAFAVVFGLLSIYVQVMDYSGRKAIYDEELIKARDIATSAGVYSQLTVPILVPPSPLSIFAKGADDKMGGQIDIAMLTVPQFENTAQKKNPFLDIFDSFDLVTLVHVLFSVMTLFLVADTIAGEREEGTLKQVFSNSLPKSQYFLTKYLGSLGIMAIPLTLIFLLAALVILLHPMIALTAAQWLSVGFIYLTCLAFVSVYVLIALALSARMQNASMASLAGLLIWILLVFVYPNGARYAVKSWIKIPSSDELDRQVEGLEQQIGQRVKAAFPPDDGNSSYTWASSGKYDIPTVIGVTTKSRFEHDLECVKRGLPIAVEGVDEISAALEAAKNRQMRQERIASIFTRLLPGHLLTEVTGKIAGTHFQMRDLGVMDQARQYRTQFLDYVRSKGAIGYPFFTQMYESAMSDNWDDYTDELCEKYSPAHYTKLNLDDIPVFRLRTSGALPQATLVDLMLLITLSLILFVAGGLLFSRSDVRVRD